MTTHTVELDVLGPWSLPTSKAFWEGFTPAALPAGGDAAIATVFLAEADLTRTEAEVRQAGDRAVITVRGDGDLVAGAAQVARFLSLDVDATGWPAVGERDPVIGALQAQLPGLRPCGFHSPYEAAVWTVLSQRIRIPQAAKLRSSLADRYGDRGALPAPAVLRGLDLDLPGRKTEYLHAVAEAALDGVLDGGALRAVPPEQAIEAVQRIKGLGPFAAELVVVRAANAPDAVPLHERRLDDEVAARYGDGATVETVSEAWRPFRTWAAVHLRAAREARLHEFA
ncbi:DNA-3-methyladenine glycosylase family protein [uncultured Amnibacterium sp.]|uniref:DNA-3-methyladenine glycosylase family protein n=1 Tax=uncultured Amnibacterium sp. TaxID=1631851 RepID=UPI0035CB6953